MTIRSRTMRVAVAFLTLFFAAASAHSQATVVRVAAPDADICAVGWSSPADARPEERPRTRLAVEFRFPEGPGLPSKSDPPDDSQRPPTAHTPPPPSPPTKKQEAVVSLFLEVENKSEKAIKAVEWEVSLIDESGGGSERVLRFRTEADVPPMKVLTHRHKFPLDDHWRSFNEAARRRDARMVVRMEAVAYADGSEWRRN
jgi:hypothetical protein